MGSDQFVGSKGAPGIAQWIISQMPAHRVYVEAFLGKGVLLNRKLRAAVNIGIEKDPEVIRNYHRRRFAKIELTTSFIDAPSCPPLSTMRAAERYIITGDALKVLPALRLDLSCLVYADPPYLARRQSDRAYYNCEMLSETEHRALLAILTTIEAMVMVSGYDSPVYRELLRPEDGWRVETKWTMTRGGTRVQEFLWMNFNPPVFFHDPRFTGQDFTDRQRVKRKIQRWKNKFKAMPPGERFAILEALTAVSDL